MKRQKIVVTGAGGFLGGVVVATAQQTGAEVVPVTRRGPGLAVDLARATTALAPELKGADAVIHLAGAMGSDDTRHARDTLGATRALFALLADTGSPARMVLASSIAVHSSDPALAGHVIDADAPLETAPGGRDAYARAKLAQETMAREMAAAQGRALTVLRPGAIYGAGRYWNAHLGPTLGPVLLCMGRSGEVPLIHVADCADAFLRAATGAGEGQALNLVEDNPPDRAAFLRVARDMGWPRFAVPLDWRAVHALARLVAPLPGARPGLLRPATLRARMMPVRYANARAKAALDWQPTRHFGPATIREGAAP